MNLRLPLAMKAFAVLFLSFLVIAIVVETSLEVRARLTSDENLPSGLPGDYRVLMVGDSVLGFLDRPPKGLAGRVKAAAPSGISISEISEPALLTKPLVERAARIAGSLRPQLVLLMVGKSDYDAALVDAADVLPSLRTLRLLRFVLSDLNLRLKRWTTAGELREARKRRIDAAWLAYSKLDCVHAIPMFAELLMEHHDSPSDEPHVRAIYDCYLREKAFDAGANFFVTLADVAKNGAVFRMYAGALKVQSAAIGSTARKAAHQEIERAMTEADPRSSFKTKLWLAKTDGDNLGFARILQEMRPSESTVTDLRTIENIRKVIRTFASNGSHVVLLQYPTDHLEVWKKNFAEFGDALSFVELREWLSALPADEVAGAIDEDIEHLTDAGADKLAPRLLKEIELQYQNRK